MKSSIFRRNSLSVFFWLMYRNLLDIRTRLRPLLIDGCVLLCVDGFVIAKLFPLFDIPLNFLAPLFVADTFLMILFIQGDTFCARITMDVIQNRFVHYHLTLPVHFFWILLSYQLTFLLETIIVSFPLMTIGIAFFKSLVPGMAPIWPLFIIHYVISLLFISSFFLFVSFRYPYSWIENNLWPRRLAPMFCIGATEVTWYQLRDFSPTLAAIGLCNPATYVVEGFRATLLEGHFLPIAISMFVLLCVSTVNFYFLKKSFLKRLDPV